jgi:hypothetical protein
MGGLVHSDLEIVLSGGSRVNMDSVMSCGGKVTVSGGGEININTTEVPGPYYAAPPEWFGSGAVASGWQEVS